MGPFPHQSLVHMRLLQCLVHTLNAEKNAVWRCERPALSGGWVSPRAPSPLLLLRDGRRPMWSAENVPQLSSFKMSHWQERRKQRTTVYLDTLHYSSPIINSLPHLLSLSLLLSVYTHFLFEGVIHAPSPLGVSKSPKSEKAVTGERPRAMIISRALG